MSLSLVILRARPDLIAPIFTDPIRALWPEFMMHDAVADLYFEHGHFDRYLDLAFAIIDPQAPEAPVDRAFPVPFCLADERSVLPDARWDGVIRWAHEDQMRGRAPNMLSALEITLLPGYRGRGNSGVSLDAVRRHAHAMGLQKLFAPVRPTAKARGPFTPIAEYAHRQSEDGLPSEPWLRIHVRAGGRIIEVASTNMIIAGNLAEWRSWTGLPLAQSGAVAIPENLVPLLGSAEQDHAAYVEPNIWVEHSILP